MRHVRIYAAFDPTAGDALLAGPPAHHLLRVLRFRAGDGFWLFNGDGYDYPLRITAVERDRLHVVLGGERRAVAPPHRYVELAPVLLKGERLDWVIQKAVELGAGAIALLSSERCEVRFDAARAARRLAHWRGVVNAACEQCGRADLPAVRPPVPLTDYLGAPPGSVRRIALVPGSTAPLAAVAGSGPVALIVGPEGGWTAAERALFERSGAVPAGLGPRPLRADTASLASLAIVMAALPAAEKT